MLTSSLIAESRPELAAQSRGAQASQHYSARVIDTVNEFSNAALDDATQLGGVFFDRRWYQLVEELDLSALLRAPIQLRYVVVTNGSKPVALCPFFDVVVPDTHYVYSFDKSFFTSWHADLAALDPRLAGVARWVGYLVNGLRRLARLTGVRTDRWTLVASPLSFQAAISTADLRPDDRRRAMQLVTETLRERAVQTGTPAWFLRVPEEERELRAELDRAQFDQLFAVYEPVIDQLGQGLDGYLGRFRAHARHAARSEMKRLARAGVTFEDTHDPSGLAPELSTLYETMNAKYGDEHFHCPPPYWSAVSRHFGPAARFVLARQSGRLVGFSLTLRKGDAIWAHHMGMVRGERELPFLYFNLAYYETIRRSAQQGVSRFWLGQGAWSTKHKRGAIGHPMHNAFFFPHRPTREVLLPWLRLFSTIAQNKLAFLTRPHTSLAQESA